jgi:hypothetical protein
MLAVVAVRLLQPKAREALVVAVRVQNITYQPV